jgi:diacylglycerol kinase
MSTAAPATSPSETRHPGRGVTTLDLLKCVAVTLMIADHVGLYLFDEVWLRILGRPAAIIFGFLIGLSATTRVPPLWIGVGLGLSLLEGLLFPERSEKSLDILISLALTRIVMPYFQDLHAGRPMLLLPAAILLLLIAEPLNQHLEYATEVTVVALLGLAVRVGPASPSHRSARDALALVVLVGLGLITIRHFELQGWQAACSAALIAATVVALSRFEHRPAATPAFLDPLLRFGGRYTLWIYAIHLVLLLLIHWWIMGEGSAPDQAFFFGRSEPPAMMSTSGGGPTAGPPPDFAASSSSRV